MSDFQSGVGWVMGDFNSWVARVVSHLEWGRQGNKRF